MKPTLNQHINRRLNKTVGELPRLKYMLVHAFSAPNFRGFWHVWNPVFSYVLLYYVYKPVREIPPKLMALVITFLVNGLFHDMMVYLFTRQYSFTITKLFMVYGIIVLIESYFASRLIIRKPYLATVYNTLLLSLPVVIITLI